MDLAKLLKIMQWLDEGDYFIRISVAQGKDDYAGYFAGRYPPVQYDVKELNEN